MQTETMEPQVVAHEPLAPRGCVLIVGTDPVFLARYGAMFESLGFTALPVKDHETALACLRLIIFEFVVVDEAWPAQEVRGLLQHAKHLFYGRTTWVVISRAPQGDGILEEFGLDAADHLLDPVSAQEMARVIATHLGPDHPQISPC